MVALCVIAYVLLAGTGRRRSRVMDEVRDGPAAPWWERVIALFLLLAVIGGVVAVVLLARGENSATPPDLSLLPASPPAAGGSLPIAEYSVSLVVHWWILAGLAILGLAALSLVILVRRRNRARAPVERASPEREDLRVAVDASLKELREAADPRQAVIHAYASMERVLSEHGLARRPSEAPLEYLARWAAVVRVGRSAAEALTTLYERARFSLHLVDEEMKQEATTALTVLRRELEEGAP